MRKLSLLILSVIFVLTSCRKEADYMHYIGANSTIAYTTYTEQFIVLWNNINTAYVFWDVDKTDWDEVYEKYVPEFEKLDARIKAGGTVSTSELEQLYQNSMGSLIDHHMCILIKNIHPNPDEEDRFKFYPSDDEIEKRDYYHDQDTTMEEIMDYLQGVAVMDEYEDYSIVDADMKVGNLIDGSELVVCYILFELPDGRLVPYLWQNMYCMTNVIQVANSGDNSTFEYEVNALYDDWMTIAIKTPADSLGGIILDNRCNIGGMADDLEIVAGSFSGKPFTPLQTRYKEGPGRLEHSVWNDLIINPYDNNYVRDLEKENIPYVVLSNLYSISMGEITSYAVSQLPTAYMIGERTNGATGPLIPGMIELTYGGPFGNLESDKHYVYTSTYEMRTSDGFIPEGIGFSPDKELLTNEVGVKGQLDAALEYIKNYK